MAMTYIARPALHEGCAFAPGITWTFLVRAETITDDDAVRLGINLAAKHHFIIVRDATDPGLLNVCFYKNSFKALPDYDGPLDRLTIPDYFGVFGIDYAQMRELEQLKSHVKKLYTH